MNVLILLDLVPRYHRLMVGVGKALRKDGHKVFYAMDSPQNLVRFPDSPPDGERRIFSHHVGDKVKRIEGEEAPWTAFFADFDRYEHYGVNYGKKQEWYEELGARLDSFFETCVCDWEIDLILYEGVTNSFAFFANRAAERHKICYLGIQASRLPGRHELHGSSEAVLRERVQGHYASLQGDHHLDDETSAWVKDYLARFLESLPDYMKSNGLNLQNPFSKYLRRENLSTFAKLFSYQLFRRGEEDLNYRSGPPLSYSGSQIRRNVVRWVRSKTLKGYFSKPEEGEQFFLYPVHFHPEASTSVNARWYVDEYPVIKNLAFSLPRGKWLYVKDHPSAVGYPERSFYRKIAALPNVRLISPEAGTKDLIKRSLGVITLTGTVGFEALVLGKPVWVLGEVFYDFHPLCRKVGWGPGLTKSFSDGIAGGPADPGEAERVVAAYYLSTLKGALPLMGEVAGTVSYAELAREVVLAAQS